MISPTRSRSGEILLWTVSAIVLTVIVLPPLIVIPFSFNAARFYQFPPQAYSLRWYTELFTNPTWRIAIANSAIVGLSAAVLAGILGTMASLALERNSFFLKGLLRDWLMFPMYIPTVVVGIGLFAVLSKVGLTGTLTGIILAHTLITIPVVMINVTAALKLLDPRLEQAAQSLGASPVVAFFAVTMPQIRGGVLAGMLFAFIISLDELVIALFLSGTEAVTLPVQMWKGIRFENNPTIAAAGTVLMVLAAIGLGISEWLRRKAVARSQNKNG